MENITEIVRAWNTARTNEWREWCIQHPYTSEREHLSHATFDKYLIECPVQPGDRLRLSGTVIVVNNCQGYETDGGDRSFDVTVPSKFETLSATIEVSDMLPEIWYCCSEGDTYQMWDDPDKITIYLIGESDIPHAD